MSTSSCGRHRRQLADLVMPWRCSFSAVTAADAPHPLHRQRVQERQLASGATTSRPSGLATPLATLARNFVRATPTVIGSPTSARIAARSRAAIWRGVPAKCSIPPHVQERLVDRQPFDGRRNSSNTRRRPCWLRSRPTSGARRRPPAGTAGGPRGRPWPCARRRRGPRSWPKARPLLRRSPGARAGGVVALLDRGVERVQVGVEDARRRSHRTYVRIPAGRSSNGCAEMAPTPPGAVHAQPLAARGQARRPQLRLGQRDRAGAVGESGEEVLLHVRDASDEQLGPDSDAAAVAALDFDHVNPVSGPVRCAALAPATCWPSRSSSSRRATGAGRR